MPGAANFFGKPIGATPGDFTFGEVDGAPISYTPSGIRYYEQYQPPPPVVPYESLSTALDAEGRAIHNRTPKAPSPIRDMMGGIVSGVTQGLTAPGRALRGEPVTYGDAWATALDYGVGSAPTSAPEGALRAGAMRGYHGSGTKGIKEWRVKRSKYDGRLTDPVFFAIDEPGTESALDYANGYNFNRMTGEDMAGQTYTVDIPANPNILDARIPEERAKLIEALDVSPRFHEGGAAFLENQSQYGSQLPGWGDDRLYDALDKAGYEGVVLQERPAVGGYGGVISTAIFDPNAVRMASDAQPGIRAYHGSPHDFDRFSMDKIGTGEGGMAQGAGMNFAGSRDRADWFRRQIAGGEDAGHLYEVNINADPEDFLDWDKPISGQKAQAKLADDLTAIAPDEKQTRPGYVKYSAGGRAVWVPEDKATDTWDMSKHVTGEDYYRHIAGDRDNFKATSEALRERGVPGVSYADEGAINFVVFDEDLISIVRKYGIAGAAAYLGMPEDEIRNRVGEM